METSGNHSPEYRKYLKSAVWAARKRRYYEKFGRFCKACEKRPVFRKWWEVWKPKDWLHLHHMSYVQQRLHPGREPDSDLIALCRRHHDEVHARHRGGQFGGYEGSLRVATMYVVDREQRKVERRKAKEARKLAKAQ